MKPIKFRAGLFKKVGEPTIASYQACRELERSCRIAAGPHTFYFTLDVRPRPSPTVSWCHNTDLHFGITRMSFRDFIRLINPEWLPIYLQYSNAANKILFGRMPDLMDRSITYSVKVPLRQMDGSYHWYNQLVRPSRFDEQGQMVAHLNAYHRVAPYNRLQPGHPIVTIDDRKQPELERKIQMAGSKALTGMLFNGLRPREFEALYHYRRHDACFNSPLTNQQLADLMKIKIHGINKHNTRILTAARIAFPAFRFATVTGLASFLNMLFGPPGNH
jgi:hypothetical protein